MLQAVVTDLPAGALGDGELRAPPAAGADGAASEPRADGAGVADVADVADVEAVSPRVVVCPVCLDRPSNTRLAPCHHALCAQCSARVRDCPLCRATITAARVDRSTQVCTVTASNPGAVTKFVLLALVAYGFALLAPFVGEEAGAPLMVFFVLHLVLWTNYFEYAKTFTATLDPRTGLLVTRVLALGRFELSCARRAMKLSNVLAARIHTWQQVETRVTQGAPNRSVEYRVHGMVFALKDGNHFVFPPPFWAPREIVARDDFCELPGTFRSASSDSHFQSQRRAVSLINEYLEVANDTASHRCSDTYSIRPGPTAVGCLVSLSKPIILLLPCLWPLYEEAEVAERGIPPQAPPNHPRGRYVTLERASRVRPHAPAPSRSRPAVSPRPSAIAAQPIHVAPQSHGDSRASEVPGEQAAGELLADPRTASDPPPAADPPPS